MVGGGHNVGRAMAVPITRIYLSAKLEESLIEAVDRRRRVRLGPKGLKNDIAARRSEALRRQQADQRSRPAFVDRDRRRGPGTTADFEVPRVRTNSFGACRRSSRARSRSKSLPRRRESDWTVSAPAWRSMASTTTERDSWSMLARPESGARDIQYSGSASMRLASMGAPPSWITPLIWGSRPRIQGLTKFRMPRSEDRRIPSTVLLAAYRRVCAKSSGAIITGVTAATNRAPLADQVSATTRLRSPQSAPHRPRA